MALSFCSCTDISIGIVESQTGLPRAAVTNSVSKYSVIAMSLEFDERKTQQRRRYTARHGYHLSLGQRPCKCS